MRIRRPSIYFAFAAAVALAALLAISLVRDTQPGFAGTVVCDPSPAILIPDQGKGNADCTVVDTGTIKDLDVSLNIKHTFVGDLEISLRHVDTGRSVLLIVRRCGAGQNIAATLDDEASDPVGTTCGSAPAISGIVRPEQPLSAFDGESFAGTWRLSAFDSAAPDEGSINGWALIATVNTGPPTRTPTRTPCPGGKVPTNGGCGTRTPTPTPTPCAPEGCPTATTTATGPPTRTPTRTPCPGGKVPANGGCGTRTPTPTPTGCAPEGCPTPTTTATGTVTRTATSTATGTPTPRATRTPTPTETDTPTPRATRTPTPTDTDTPTPTDTPVGATATPETPTATGSPTATRPPTATRTPGAKPAILKSPRLANLWLCNTGAPTCDNKASGVEQVNFNVDLDLPITSPDPKCTGFPNFRDPATCPRQTLGSFEFEVRFNPKLVSVKVEPGSLWFVINSRPVLDPNVSCATTEGEGFVQFRCVTKGKERVVFGPGTLAVVRVRPTADVRSILIPNQLNGIATQLINQDCQLADLQGHPIPVAGDDACEDAAITIRYLEGDVHADCVVDVHDQQQIAFRWGARLGQLLFNDRYDLEPSAPKKGDDDIDAKDLQLVYGRHGSTCKDPHPPQPPIDPKAKVEPANPALAAAIREHAARFAIPPESITANVKEAADWPDSCLGLPGPSETCLDVITPGFRIVLKHDGVACTWRTNADGTEVRLEGCIV